MHSQERYIHVRVFQITLCLFSQALRRTFRVLWDVFAPRDLWLMKLQCWTVAVSQTLSHTDLHWTLRTASHAMVSSG